MRFRITRTSNGMGEQDPPCDGVRFDKAVDGTRLWSLEIETLDELLQFVRGAGNPVIVDIDPGDSDEAAQDPIPSIEIYDTYRE